MPSHPIDHTRATERGPMLALAAGGVLYFLLAWLPQLDGPDVETATAPQIRAWLANHELGMKVLATGTVLAIPLVLVLTVSLARLIRLRAPGSPLADLVTGAGVLLAVWHWFVTAATSSTLVQALDGTDLATVDDATLRGWYGVSNVSHLFADLGMPAMATVMAATSIAALRTGILPRWIAWAGLVFATGGTAGTVGVTIASEPVSWAWFVGIFGWFVWVLAVAISSALRARGTASAGEREAVPVPAQ